MDEADVGSPFKHVGGAAVAEDVATSWLSDVGLFDELAYHSADDVGVEFFAVGGDEEGFFVGI